MIYKGSRWEKKRKHILLRDKHMDQYAIRSGVRCEADTVHHILPAEEWPEYQWEDWNLISVHRSTHRQLHEKYTGRLSPEGYSLALETAQAQGIKLTTVTMVIGLPGSGKTTWTRQNIGGGIAYDLDQIASAFRLQEEHTAGSRRMAAAIRSAWVASAAGYADRIFIIRTAPDYEELAETCPDRIVVCTEQRAKRDFDREELQQNIDAAIEWAEANHVHVEYSGGKHP